MKKMTRSTMVIAAILLVAGLTAILAQQAEEKKEPGHVMLSIHHIAPGKHLEFLKWQAAREAVDREAGVPATQWYAHTDGDSWDYISIGPDTTKEQDARIDEIAKKKGLKTGFVASLEFRTFISSHTDTQALGPVSAAQLVGLAEK